MQGAHSDHHRLRWRSALGCGCHQLVSLSLCSEKTVFTVINRATQALLQTAAASFYALFWFPQTFLKAAVLIKKRRRTH